MNRSLLQQELIRDEGNLLNVYKDSVGLYTIGVGHLLGDKMRMTTITHDESMALLAADIARAIEVAQAFLPQWSGLDDVRQRVLVNMAFNIGGRIGGFHALRAALVVLDWTTASQEMMNSQWATQVGARAVRLSTMMLTGKVA